jgi:hypothetical protein
MTDDEIKRIMEKLEKLKITQLVPQDGSHPVAPPPPVYPEPQPWQPYDGLPLHWGPPTVVD